MNTLIGNVCIDLLIVNQDDKRIAASKSCKRWNNIELVVDLL